MKITRVTATNLHIPVTLDVLDQPKHTQHNFCVVEVETEDGLVGQGMSSIGPTGVIAHAVNTVAGPAILGDDALNHARVWEKLYWLLAPRGQTGVAMHAIAAIDVALWDLKGKALDQPVWRLLGGARDRCQVYATFGFGFYDRDELAEAARRWWDRGFKRLKMTVGMGALAGRETRPVMDVIREDLARVTAVREAVPEAELYLDANCSLDLYHAAKLASWLEPLKIGFFEEPITGNDVLQMAELRRRTSIPLACGQNEGLAYRFRDLFAAGAVDIAQPNVAITGGFTQCQQIAGMAAAYTLPVENGGAWPFHNMHLQAGVPNGTMVEYHHPGVTCCQRIYRDLPEPEDGWIDLPDRPGLGFELDPDAVRELTSKES